MKIQLIREARMSDTEKHVLRNQLDRYYENVHDYMAFSAVSEQTECWKHIENGVKRRDAVKCCTSIKILEVGSGKSGFGGWLKKQGIRSKVQYWAQDVTAQNAEFLTEQADQVVIADVSEIAVKKYFDVVFSTYVLEHVTNPSQHLNHLYSLLADGGSLFIFCPRYDVLGYLCPSSRHLSIPVRLRLELKWGMARFVSRILQRPAFLIQTDLAAFHQPFFPDADAVHWVSLLDLKLWAQIKGAQIHKLKIGNSKVGSKDWMVKRWLTCSVEFRKICKK